MLLGRALGVGGQLSARPYSIAPTKDVKTALSNHKLSNFKGAVQRYLAGLRGYSQCEKSDS